jgi:hypothetical protein
MDSPLGSIAASVSKIVAIELAPRERKGEVFAALARPPLRSSRNGDSWLLLAGQATLSRHVTCGVGPRLPPAVAAPGTFSSLPIDAKALVVVRSSTDLEVARRLRNPR